MQFFPQPQAPKVFAEGSFVNPLRKDQIQQRKEEVCALLASSNSLRGGVKYFFFVMEFPNLWIQNGLKFI